MHWRREIGVVFVSLFLASVGRAGPLGLERAVSEPFVNLPEGNQQAARLWPHGTGWWAVWEDSRGGDFDVWAAHLDGTGVVQHQRGLPLDRALGDQRRPDLAVAGDRLLVAWRDEAAAPGAPNVAFAVFDAATGAQRTPRTALTSAAVIEGSVAVGTDGTSFVVVWGGDGTANDLVAARIDQAGTVLQKVTVCGAAGNQRQPSVAFDGTRYLVAWEDRRATPARVRAARLSADLAVLDPDGFPLGGAAGVQANPVVAWSSAASRFLVAWEAEPGIELTRVTSEGVVQDAAGVVVSAQGGRQPALRCGTQRCLVAWDAGSPSAVLGTRVEAATAALVDPAALILSPGVGSHGQGDTAVAVDGSGWLVVSRQTEPRYRQGEELYARFVDPDGVVTRPVVEVALGSNPQRVPALGFDGQRTWVGWRDDVRGGGWTSNYFLSQFDAAWVRVQTEVQVSESAASSDLIGLAVTTGGALLGWGDDNSGGQFAYRRVDPLGVPQGPRQSVGLAASYCFEPAFATDGTGFLAVAGCNDSDLWAARFGASGAPLGSFKVSQAAGVQSSPTVVFDGTRYLVAWRDARNDTGDVYGARVETDGTLLDPDGIALVTGSGTQASPSLAVAENTVLLAWQDGATGRDEVQAARFTSALASGGSPFLVAAGEAPQRRPRTAPLSDQSFVVAWEDGAGRGDVWLRRVLSSGLGDPLAVASTVEREREPAIAEGPGSGEVLVAYSRFDADPAVLASRVFVQRLVLVAGEDAGAAGPDATSPEDANAAGADAAPLSDAGVADAAVDADVDGGSVSAADAARAEDAQAVVAGVDVGAEAGRIAMAVGCGCGRPGSPWAPLLLLPLTWAMRRRANPKPPSA